MALRFINSLIRFLEANSMSVAVSSEARNPSTFVTVDGEQIQVVLRECVRKSKRPLTPAEVRNRQQWSPIHMGDSVCVYQPTGKFVFQVGRDSEASGRLADTKAARIDDCIELIACKLRAAAAIAKRRQAATVLARQREAEARHLWMKERDRIERLRANSVQWEDALRIRAYLAAVEARAAADGLDLAKGGSMWRFLAWANRYADGLDPTGSDQGFDSGFDWRAEDETGKG